MNAPVPRHSIRKLAEMTGTTLRTRSRWVPTGAVSSTWFRGPATTYGARHVDEVHAVKRLLAENLSLEAIRGRLTRLTDDELARFLRPEPVAGVAGAAAVEAATLEGPTLAGATTTGMLEQAPIGLETTYAVERWEPSRSCPG